MRIITRLRRVIAAPKGLVFIGGLILCLVLAAWPSIVRYHRIATVQNLIQRNWEITWNDEEPPKHLPKALDKKLYDFIQKKYEHTHGVTNQDIILSERWRALFRGKIRKIHIYYCERFHLGLGEALAKFTNLEDLLVTEYDDFHQDPAAVDELFDSIAKMDRLKRLEIEGFWLNDTHLTRLAKHPTLETLILSASSITGESASIFEQMPALKQLEIIESSLSKSELQDLVWSLPDVIFDHDDGRLFQFDQDQ